MNKNKKFYFVGITVFVIVLVLTLQNTIWAYKEYIPVILKGDQLVETKELLTEHHKENIGFVLTFYEEKWKIVDGKVFVSRKIDDDTLWNYTSKANDVTWLAKRRF